MSEEISQILAGARIRYAHQIQVGLDIAGRHGAEFLSAQRNAFLRNSFGLGKVLNRPVNAAVQHDFELGGQSARLRIGGAQRSSAGIARQCRSRRTARPAENRASAPDGVVRPRGSTGALAAVVGGDDGRVWLSGDCAGLRQTPRQSHKRVGELWRTRTSCSAGVASPRACARNRRMKPSLYRNVSGEV